MYQRAKYRCSGKATSKTLCDGQSVYSADKYETAILNQVNKYLDSLTSLEKPPEDKEIMSINKNIRQLENKLQKINLIIEKLSEEVDFKSVKVYEKGIIIDFINLYQLHFIYYYIDTIFTFLYSSHKIALLSIFLSTKY